MHYVLGNLLFNWCIWNTCLKIYDIIYDLACFLIVPGLAWQAALKKNKVKLNLLTDVDGVIVQKGVRGEICHTVRQYSKANNKGKIMIKNGNILSIGIWIIQLHGQCHKSCP